MSRTLATALDAGRAAGLDHVRLAAALAVVVSHAWPLALGPGTTEPLKGLVGVSLGHCAVLVFFFLSGVLIARSAETRAPGAFWKARVLRIGPGLLLALLVTLALAVATGATPTPGEGAEYVLRGLSLAALEHQLTGAFAANPFPGAVNGPLWTLFYEVACYALVAVLIWSGLVRTPRHWLLMVIAAACLTAATKAGLLAATGIGYRLTVGAPLVFAFLCGSLAWQVRTQLVLSMGTALASLGAAAILAMLVPGSALAEIALASSLGYAALTLGLRPGARPLGGDISYGVYILGWPVAQTLVAILGPIAPGLLALLSVATVLPLAALSWRYVEQPALGLARSRARRIEV